ncbi:BTB/POZ domain-containing protein 2 [Orchesella cincta]|uniref:BTB/POZ domain-containing protein 2 n=1 Tax=Orchesella cincta TaxID=48709 RepID=A0A1D2MTP3_ORCCI|nr:BTB/POZ domain-containing protein 2 [Orchesella cincta]
MDPNMDRRPWDWNAMVTWKGRARTLMESEYLSDATIVLSSVGNDGNEKCYNVHRIFMESASPSFQRLFREADDTSMGGRCTILISDTPSHIMDMIIRYVYLDEVEIQDLDQSLELLGSAICYKVFGLIRLLCPRIINQIKSDNALKIYKCAHEWDKVDIKEAAMDIICRDADVLIETIEFLELPEECVAEIIRRDDLGVSSELKLYYAVKRWGEMKCEREGLDPLKNENLRSTLRNLVGTIRFPLMDQEEFTLNVGVNNQILNMEDMVAILLYFTVPKEKRSGIPPGRFKSNPRVRNRERASSSASNDCQILGSYNSNQSDLGAAYVSAARQAPANDSFPDLRDLIAATRRQHIGSSHDSSHEEILKAVLNNLD